MGRRAAPIAPMTPEGLIVHASVHGPKETMDRLARAVTGRGMAVLARIDHAAAAVAAGMELRPTEVLIFGNPRAGTPLMQAGPGLALPQWTIDEDAPQPAQPWRYPQE